MPANTPNLGLPYPLGPDPVNVAGDISALALAIDDAMGGAGGTFVRTTGDTMTGALVARAGVTVGGTTPGSRTILFEDGSAVFENGATVSPPDELNFGTGLRQMLGLYTPAGQFVATYGIGVQSNTLYFRSASQFVWWQGGTHQANYTDTGNGNELMRLNSTGALHISRLGTTGTPIVLYGNDTLAQCLIDFGDSHGADLGIAGSSGGWFQFTAQQGIPALLRSTEGLVRIQAQGTVDIYAGDALRTRFNTSGGVFVSKSQHDDNVVGLEWYENWASVRATCNVEDAASLYLNRVGAGTGVGEEFARFDMTGTLVGSITRTSAGVSYNTTSDYRTKTVDGPISGADALTAVQALKPVMATYLADDTQTSVGTFIAHEVQAVVPSAVTGEKDAVDSTGQPAYQQLDMTRMIPVIVAAIQELAARLPAA